MCDIGQLWKHSELNISRNILYNVLLVRSTELFRDDQCSVHLFVAVAAKYIAREAEFSCLVWRKTHAGDSAGLDIAAHLKFRQLEPVDPVFRGQFQNHGHPFFDGDRAGAERKILGRHADHLLAGETTHISPRRRCHYG